MKKAWATAILILAKTQGGMATHYPNSKKMSHATAQRRATYADRLIYPLVGWPSQTVAAATAWFRAVPSCGVARKTFSSPMSLSTPVLAS